MFMGLVIAIMLIPYSGKIIPGGPFLSIRGDVMPIIISCIVLTIGLRAYRTASLGSRLLILLFCGIALFFIITVLENVVMFATDKYARGPLLDW